MPDDRKLTKTRFPGIYKRGTSYVAIFHANGRQRKVYARTLAEARKLKAARTADVARGEFHEQSQVRFAEYGPEWVERYQGTGRRGFRESTRDDYRRDLANYAVPFFGERKRLSEITPRDVSRFVAWLCDENAQGKRLADATVRRIVSPVRSCLSTAVQEGLIRSNPTRDVALPHREKVREDEEEDVRPFTRQQLAAFLSLVHPSYRLMFRFLAATGLRWSELIGLQWRHLHLDGSQPHVQVRRGIVRGRIEPPKSKHGRRNVPLDVALVSELRWLKTTARPDPDALVFPSQAATPLNHSNTLSRVLRPVAEEVGAPWAGFHTFRHTCATLLFHGGRNAKQVQKWLGHHAASFTLDRYIHLLGDDMGEALSLDAELSGATNGATRAHKPAQDDGAALPPDFVPESEILIQPEIAQAA